MRPQTERPSYLSIARASRATGVWRQRILDAVNAGKVRVVEKGNLRKYHVADIEALGQTQEPVVAMSATEFWRLHA